MCECAHSSLDVQSGSLVLSEGSPSIWPSPVLPAAVFQPTVRCGGKHALHHRALYPLLGAARQTGESNEKLSFAKLAFMSFLFPELHCSAPGLDLRWMLLSSFPAYRCPSLSSIRIPAFLYQITCLSLLASIFLPIAIHCSSPVPFCFALLCLCGVLSISLSMLSVTGSPSHSFYLTVR